MPTPVIHLLAGPNGAGKTTLAERVIQPVTHLPFVNADVIAKDRWPGHDMEHALEASAAAAVERDRLMNQRQSFITETVFSHPSKVGLVEHLAAAGYLVHLHLVLVPVEVTVRRVRERVGRGGHDVPDQKIRERYDRLWPLVVQALPFSDVATFYDNSTAKKPFAKVAVLEHGRGVGPVAWPSWVSTALQGLPVGPHR